MRRPLLVLLAGALAACGEPALVPDAGLDSGPELDSGAARDSGAERDAGARDAAMPDAGPRTHRDFTTEIQNSRGVIVARDGTIYFTQLGGVGRVTTDGTIETDWLTITGVSLAFSLALDPSNDTLFVGAPAFGAVGVPTIFRVDVATATETSIHDDGNPYGLAMGPDGMLYFSDGSVDHVFRMSPTGGTATPVTTSPLMAAGGLAFEADGSLLVASSYLGQVFRLTLSASGTETARDSVGIVPAAASVALDALGRIYATSNGGGALLRMNADGSESVPLRTMLSAPWSIDFGSGVLYPTDIYIVAGNGQLFRYENDTPGADVSWH